MNVINVRYKHTHHGWVVTHRDAHDDSETSLRAITDYATNATIAWEKFLQIVDHDQDQRKTWLSRGYVARRVKIVVTIENN